MENFIRQRLEIMRAIAISSMLAFPFSCHQQDQEKKLFEEVSPDHSNINFENRVVDDEQFNIINYRNFYNGGGVAIGDINNDGLPDIFLVANMADNKLFLNRGNFVFEDISSKAGMAGTRAWSTGVSMADINGDGYLDIYVCNSGRRKGDDRSNELFINNKDLTFTESAKRYHLDDPGYSTHAAFFDYDLDGDLDAYILNNSFYPIGRLAFRNIRNERDPMGGHKLLRNDGELFTDVSEDAGIYGSVIGFGLGVAVADVNNDHWPDMYISNDFYERDYLYINNRDGTFSENIKEAMAHISLSSMGADIADINNDEFVDVFSTDMLPKDERHLKQMMAFENHDLYTLKLERDFHHQIQQNALQLNNHDGTFSEIARFAGVEATDWSWGALIFDMNNDGRKDIFVANGVYRDMADQDFLRFLGDRNRLAQAAAGKQFSIQEFLKEMPSRPVPNFAFENKNGVRFENRAESWGLARPGFSNGAAYGDLDNDGDLDLVVNNMNSPASIYRNTTDGAASFLRIQLKGSSKNVFGVGAKVKVFYGGEVQLQEQMPNRGFQSSVDPVLVFGLNAQRKVIDSIHVIWPGGQLQSIKKVQLNSTIVVEEAPTRAQNAGDMSLHKWFFDITNRDLLQYKHQENVFIDYYQYPMQKQMLSTQTPSFAGADVNNDGLEDLLICGAVGDGVKLFVQDRQGGFKETTQAGFEESYTSENVKSIFFDCDNDRDQDLYVATGGNEFAPNDEALRDRLYLNNGKGHFTLATGLPDIRSVSSCVATADVDRDGDVDAFVGARMIAGQYGNDAASQLLINDGKGNFVDRASTVFVNPALGMVTGAVWQDIDNDSFVDLIVVGDWMGIQIYKNEQGKKFSKVQAGTANLAGWWNCIKPADLDGDGDVDFILGNLGENNRYHVDAAHPAKLYVSDFDGNGAQEHLVALTASDTKSYPMMLKHDIEKQLPMIKKRFLKYADYAGRPMDEIFSRHELERAKIKNATEPRSGIVWNEGKGDFSFVAMPDEVQFSSVHAIEVLDFNKDGVVDIVLAGNFYDVLPELGPYDASYGIVLQGEGKKRFRTLLPYQSGFFVEGQVRDLRKVDCKGRSLLLVGRNNMEAKVFEIRSSFTE